MGYAPIGSETVTTQEGTLDRMKERGARGVCGAWCVERGARGVCVSVAAYCGLWALPGGVPKPPEDLGGPDRYWL